MNELNNLKPIYYPSEENLDTQLFLPIAKTASTLDCMVGYFTSGSLRELSRAIICYLKSSNESKMRFIVSPNLAAEDLEAIRDAINYDKNLIPLLFPGFDFNEKTLHSYTVRALCYLVAVGKLEIKVALKNNGLFHSKCWIFETEHGLVAVHGSSNATNKGLTDNFEQLVVSRSWKNDEAEYICQDLKSKFTTIWNDKYNGIQCLQLNNQTIDYINKIKKECLDKNLDEAALLEALTSQLVTITDYNHLPQQLKIPDWLNYQSGDFKHQGKAVQAWMNNNKQGIFSIATGGGKTLTALVAATLLNQNEKKLLVVIAVPTAPLLNQWEDEVKQFGINAFNTIQVPGQNIKIKLREMIRRLKHGSSNTEVIIITNDALGSDKLDYLGTETLNIPILLIGDEVHNLGSPSFKKKSPEFYQYRLGLSATPERQFDDEGTDFLFSYFGGIVFEYSLKEAIGNCLVPFDYYVHDVLFTTEEEEKFAELSFKIKKLGFAIEAPKGDPAKDRFNQLCIERRRVVETAENKIRVFKEILPKNKSDITKTLIFCTDKHPEQILQINSILNERNVSFHQITQNETSNPALLARVLKSFNSNDLQVLTSKRVLDEGFNVPQTQTAYLIASATGKRQWIQRLGRVLRLSPKTQKSKAVIHDFMVLPSICDGGADTDLVSLLRGEYNRLTFFTSLSSNGLEVDGSSHKLIKLLELIKK